MREGFIMLVGLVMLAGGIVGLTITVNKVACETYSEQTGKVTEYAWPAGCFIEHNGEKVLWDEYKYRLATLDAN